MTRPKVRTKITHFILSLLKYYKSLDVKNGSNYDGIREYIILVESLTEKSIECDIPFTNARAIRLLVQSKLKSLDERKTINNISTMINYDKLLPIDKIKYDALIIHNESNSTSNNTATQEAEQPAEQQQQTTEQTNKQITNG
jgi:hypothetical protein